MATTDVPSYEFNAKVIRWVDGDTVDLRVDLGFYLTVDARFRSYGINTPERGQPGYDAATQRANQLAPVGGAVQITTYRPVADKYGRFLATVVSHGINVNQTLVDEGLAVPYFGGTK